MKLTVLQFLDRVMPLNQWMTVREIAKTAKEMGIVNLQRNVPYSVGAIKSAIARSIERREGLFKTVIEKGRLLIKRVKDGCYDFDVKQAIAEYERKRAQNPHTPKALPKISQKMKLWPKPSVLGEKVYTSSKIYV